MSLHRLEARKRRLSAERLEDRALLTSVPTPAAIQAESVAAAVQASSPAAPAASAANQAGIPNQAVVSGDYNFISNIYSDLLGRNPGPSEVQFWQTFLDANVLNNLATVGSTGSQGVGNSVSGAPVGGYALTEAPNGNNENTTTPTGPTSGPGLAISEYNYGNNTFAETSYPNGTGMFTSGTNAGDLGASPGSTNQAADTSSLAESESVYQATAMSSGQAAAVTSQGRADMVQAVLASPEYRDRLVTQIYNNFLHRAPDGSALSFWSGLISTAGEKQVMADILASPEYYRDAGGTDLGYIDALYRDILGRAPGAAGEQYWLSQLAANGGGGPARAMVALGILSSPEASSLLINNPTQNALAGITGGGYNDLFFQGGLGAAEQQVYTDALGGSTAFENVIESMVVDNQFYQLGTGPGAGDNPALTTGGAG